jgi:large subunit ribosomal protein L9
MKIILKEDVSNLGSAGEIVTVKDGYARNYLIPNQLAMRASTGNVKQLDHARRLVDAHRRQVAATSQELRERLVAAKVQITRRAGDEDKLYGSVTNMDIADELARQGVEIDRRTIQLEEPIKTLGEHIVHVKLKEAKPAPLTVQVVAERD